MFFPLLPTFLHLSWIHGELPFVNGIGGHTPLTITPGPCLSQTNMAVGTSVAVSCEGRLHRCKVCKGVVAQHLRIHKHHSENERIHVWDRKWGIRCMSNKGINAKHHPSCTMGPLPTGPTIIDTWSVCTTALAHPCTVVAHLLNGGVRWRHHIERTRCCCRCIGLWHGADGFRGAPIASRNCCPRFQ